MYPHQHIAQKRMRVSELREEVAGRCGSILPVANEQGTPLVLIGAFGVKQLLLLYQNNNHT